MGLMEILNGMQNGPRGSSQPAPPASTGTGRGMSPVMTALLALLAYKAVQGGGLGNILTGGQQNRAAPGTTTATGQGGLGDLLGGLLGGNRPAAAPGGGGLGDMLGGLLGGGAAGSALNSGLGNLLQDFQNAGYGKAAQSWVGTGQNQDIAPNDLAKALGDDTLSSLTSQTGLSRNQLLDELSAQLPDFVDKLTPNGRLPTEQEAARW